MKIVLISARHSSPFACETYIHKALLNMGHQIVADLDFRTGSDTVNERIPKNADLLLAWKGSSLDPEVILDLKYPTVLWYPDFWQMIHTQNDIEKLGGSFDFLYTPILEDAKLYKSWGLNAEFLSPGVDCEVFHKINPPLAKEYDVVFVGSTDPSVYPNRIKDLETLTNQGYKVAIGNGLDHKSMNIAFNKAKMVYNDGVVSGQGVQLRCFEAMASGSLLLNSYCEDLIEVGLINRHMTMFVRSPHFFFNTLSDQVGYNQKNESLREQIATDGLKEVQKNHTWEKRLQEIIDNLERNSR